MIEFISAFVAVIFFVVVVYVAIAGVLKVFNG
jgi:hypothetical protein